METGIGESSHQGPSCSASESADFECNICFDLAQDPIVTLCGHLFCWPCLYRWLRHHSHSHECPVCKALVQEEKLVPIYGRGKISADPRSRSMPGFEIPQRPTGQRSEVPPPLPPQPEANYFPNLGFGLMGGFLPMATARFGNVALSAAFGGLFPSLFNIQVHGFPDPTVYGTATGFPFGFTNGFHGGHVHAGAVPRPVTHDQSRDSYLKMLLLMIGIFVIITLIWS